MDYSAKDIFNTAKNFNTANSVLKEKLSITNDIGTFITPIATLTSFSIELYLKCIYVIEHNRPAPNIHKLDKLFQKLSEESKIVIKLFYDTYVKSDQLVASLKIQVPELNTELENCLQEASEAFVKWRYNYEKNLCGLPTGGPIINALKARIQLLKPEWFPKSDEPNKK